MSESSLSRSIELAELLKVAAVSFAMGEFLTAIGGVLHGLVSNTPVGIRAEMVKFVVGVLRQTAAAIEQDNQPCGESHANTPN